MGNIIDLNTLAITDIKVNENFRSDDEGIKLFIVQKREFSFVEYHTNLRLMNLGDDSIKEFSLIKEISILNHTSNFYKDLKLKIEFSNINFSPIEIFLVSVDSFSDVKIKIPYIKANLSDFDILNEKSECIYYSLYDNLGNLITKEEIYYNLLPLSQPPRYTFYDKRLFSKYVIANSKGVKELTLNAVKFLKNNVSFRGYDTTKDGIIDEVAAIYNQILDYGINYQMPPVGGLYLLNDSLDIEAQRLRLQDEVINDRKATCIDMSLLFAALIEEVGLNPILIFIEGHAFVGVFLEQDYSFINGIETNITKIYNASSAGINKILLFEATLATKTNTSSFDEAIEYAFKTINEYKKKSFCAIDVKTCHKTLFLPIPLELNSDKLNLEDNNELSLDSNTKPIIETKVLALDTDYKNDRFQFWSKKLLDLTEINPLVCYKMSLSNTIKLKSKSPIYDLVKNNESLKIYSFSKSKKNDILSKSQEELFKSYEVNDSFIYELSIDDNTLFSIGYDSTLRNILKKNQTSIEETGAQTMYLCMGLLEYENKKGTISNAPFILIPISIKKDKTDELYEMRLDYDNIMLNETFFEYYKLNFGISFDGFYNLVANNNYLDIVRTFKEYQTKIKLKENYYYICNLSFSHYIMWLDIKRRQDELKNNNIVKSIIESRNLLDSNIDDYDIESKEVYESFASPLSYDSTQLKAILEAANEKSFILDGPPGTGKSQTIVNMIINSFYNGKKVLFVAEKKAALDVVYDRLKRIKLDRFALELHSNKASKQEFFNKLGDTIDFGATKKNDEFITKCYILDSKKEEIKNTINSIKDNKYYFSLYDSIVSYLSLKDNIDSEFLFDESYIKSLNDITYNQTKELFNNVLNISKNIKNFDDTLLKEIGTDYINLYDKNQFISEFDVLYNKLVALIEELDKLKEYFSYEYDINNTKLLINILNNIYDNNLYLSDITYFILNNDDEKILSLFDKGTNLDELLNKYNYFNKDKLLKLNTDDAISDLSCHKSFIKKILTNNKYKKELKALLNEGNTLPKLDLLTIYKDIKLIQEYNEYIISNSYDLDKVISIKYIDNLANVNSIKESFVNTRNLISNIKLIDNDFYNSFNKFKDIYDTKDIKLKTIISIVSIKYNDFVNDFNILKDKYLLSSYLANNKFEFIKEFILEAKDINKFNDVIDIASINKLLNDACKLNIIDFISYFKDNKLEISSLLDSYLYSLSNSFIKLYFSDDNINFFNPNAFEKEINKYKELIDEYNNIVIEEVSYKLSSNLINTSIKYAESSPIGKLKKLVQSGGRNTSIRDTLINYGNIIKAYYPCFLMSPLSVAQYLPLMDENTFDVVIFDEASQIPVHEAIGAIARGKSLVVAGDPMQMPPSMYFQADVTSDDITYEDSPSLLDECLAIGLPRIRLKYHYRSKNEELIKFSNDNFYDSSLYTFPEFIKNDALEFIKVDLEKTKKTSDITKEEIDAIVNKVKEIYSKEENKNKSVGIIVFNMRQQEKVYDAISNLISTDTKIRDILDNILKEKGESLFVKSLENVQGDERDIIILSIGFRLNQMGKASIVGPLARINGERRLNVAVTRAKEKMVIISTIDDTNFEADNLITSKGALLLKHFLAYAYNNSLKLDIINDKDNVSGLKQFIKKDLERLGYKVKADIGDSKFKIDLAILDENTLEYKLGILIDNDIVKDTSLRDKLYVMSNILNGLGWNIINVYSIEYFKDKNKVIDKIIDSLDKPVLKEIHKIDANIKKGIEDVAYNRLPYKVTKSNNFVSYDLNNGFSFEIELLLDDIINTEAPISFNLIKERIKENSNIKVVNQKAIDRIKIALRRKGYIKTIEANDLEFYHPVNTFNLLNINYRAAYKRDIFDISREEIISAMNDVITIQGNISKEDLFKHTLIAFGYEKQILSKNIRDRLDYVYEYAKTNNLLYVVE